MAFKTIDEPTEVGQIRVRANAETKPRNDHETAAVFVVGAMDWIGNPNRTPGKI